MRALLGIGAAFLLAIIVISFPGCDKERVVTSTETVTETKYVQLPPDTVVVTDTVSGVDTLIVHDVDTVHHTDTVHVNTVIHDTVRVTVNHYDTTRIIDTVTVTQYQPSAVTAVAAMQAQTDPMVLEFAYEEFGLSDGWVFYLTPAQMDVVQASAKVWDVYAYVDYWASDFSGYYPLEIYWRMTYVSGDPSDADNWTMTDPPSTVSGRTVGVSASARSVENGHRISGTGVAGPSNLR